MSNFFLYLPLFYANGRNWFGYLAKTGADVDVVTLDATRKEQSDVDVIRALWPTRAGDAGSEFCVCDPYAVFKHGTRDGRSPAVLAALVTNTAFWAVNHGTYGVKTFSDLSQYQRVIAFKEGSTSHRIAATIAAASKVPTDIIPVKAGQELIRLASSPRGTIALTPNVLQLAAFGESTEGFQIELPIGQTREFLNRLVTVLVSRKDVVEANRDVVVGLVAAMRLAILRCQAMDADVIDFAAKFFLKKPALVEKALRESNDQHLFAASMEVTRAEWLSAIGDRSTPANDPEGEHSAVRAFQEFVEPYRSLARNLRTSEVEAVQAVSKKEVTRLPTPLQRLGLPLAGVGGSVFLMTRLQGMARVLFEAGSLALAVFGLGALTLVYYRTARDGHLHRSLVVLLLLVAATVGIGYASSKPWLLDVSWTLGAVVVGTAMSTGLWRKGP